jgi:hypothetical protein
MARIRLNRRFRERSAAVFLGLGPQILAAAKPIDLRQDMRVGAGRLEVSRRLKSQHIVAADFARRQHHDRCIRSVHSELGVI